MYPTCCIPVQRSVKYISGLLFLLYVWNLVESLHLLVVGSIMIGNAECSFINYQTLKDGGEFLVIIAVLMLLVSLLGLHYAIILMQAATEQDKDKCRQWMIAAVVILTLDVIFFWTNVGNGNPVQILLDSIDVIICLWALWVVKTFRAELFAEQDRKRLQFNNPLNTNSTTDDNVDDDGPVTGTNTDIQL